MTALPSLMTRPAPARSVSPVLAPSLDAESTTDLLERMRRGDATAIETLFSRLLPQLRRWARGRLPTGARDLLDTDDLVQDTALKVLPRLDAFDSRGQGALQAYLRQAVLNRICDEARRRRPIAVEIDERRVAADPSPLDEALGREAAEAYEQALQRLTPTQRQSVIARIELGQSYDEIAVALSIRPPTPRDRSSSARCLPASGLLHGE